ncbi:MAG: Riboflavin biosynthesis protein RibF [Candidatus Dichloromethanomonas elyunquensis]|nr:MAG: Riboflavin biosynthesis protein RibF [Candidatus Dichloromethanomonas elyunquensis]
MKIIHIEPGQQYQPSVIALGNFDGVHLGHQKLLHVGLQKAKLLQIGLSVLLFDPYPLKVLYPEKKLNLLTGKEERLTLFEKIGVNQVFLLPFTLDFATTSPLEFVEKILLNIGAVHVVVGFNYSFGFQGKGNPKDLEEMGNQFGFGVSVIQAQKIGEKIISSTEIRRYLINGEIETAKEMIGRVPKITGKVVHGDGRGRNLGYPTANVQADEDLLIPKNGVYAVTSEIDGIIYGGMMNIGVRPTFTDEKEKTIEIYFLDYHGDLYGKELDISIEARLRPERKFNGKEEIIRQLNKDKEEAVRVLSTKLKNSYQKKC